MIVASTKIEIASVGSSAASAANQHEAASLGGGSAFTPVWRVDLLRSMETLMEPGLP